MIRFGRSVGRLVGRWLAVLLGGLLVAAPAVAQPADPLANLRRALAHATTDTARGRLYWALSEITDTSANIQLYAERAIPLLRGALPHAAGAERLRLLRLLGGAINNQGVGYLSQGMASRAQQCYVRAARLRQLGGDVRGQIESLYNLASVRFSKGDNARALHLYQQGVRAGEHVPAARGQVASCLQGMGSVYVQLGDTAAGLRCLEQVLLLAEQAREPALLAGRLIDIGEKYLEWRGDTARTEACARQLQQLAARTPGTGGFLIRALLLQGEIRLRQRRWGEARALLQQANQGAERQQEAEMKLNSETTLARVEELTGHPALALRYAQRAAADIPKSAAMHPRQQTEELLSRLYEQAGQTGPALAHYRRFVRLRDSARDEANQRATYRQRLSYEYDQKEVLLRGRQEKRQAVAQAEISRQKLLRNAVTGGAALLSLLALVLWQRFRFQRRARRLIEQQKTQVEAEKQRSDELLLNILPADVADELKANGKARARQHAGVTVLFADVVSFTQLAEHLSPDQLVEALDTYFGTFDRLSEQFGLEKIKTIGDAYLLAGGLRGNLAAAPADVVRCALAMQQAVAGLAEARATVGYPTFVWRIGIHTGPVVAGVVGLKKFAYDIWGDTVNTAARMEQSSAAGRVNISEATYERVRAGFDCVARGQIAVKHKDPIAMYFVEGERAVGVVSQ